MTPVELLEKVGRHGAELLLVGDRPVLRGGSLLPVDLASEVRTRAPEIRAALEVATPSPREDTYQAAMGTFRRRYGVAGAVDTGPATMTDVDAARGTPGTHAVWPTPPVEGSLAHADWSAGRPPRYTPDETTGSFQWSMTKGNGDD